jgi:hypothetical protein
MRLLFRNFWAGNPLSSRDQAARLAAALKRQIEYERAARPGARAQDIDLLAKHAVLAGEAGRVDRVTEKSIGLLQFLAIEAALVTIGQGAKPNFAWSIAPVAASSVLLLWNLLNITPRDARALLDLDGEIRRMIVLAGRRSLRLMIGILLAAVSFVQIAAVILFDASR